MDRDRDAWRTGVVAGAVLLAAAVGCGGGGGGGGGGGDARVSGNVATASTAERQSATKTWLARIGEEVLGLARRAYAAADSTLGGITITVSRGSSDSNDVTDDQGNFDLPNAPSGDVTVSFQRGSCNASVSLPDVAEGSTLDLQDVTVACNDASPGKVAETFQGVILNKPNSPNGNLNVCAFAGGGNHHRAVNSSGSTNFVGTSFAALQVGDIIESTGARAGNGGNSTLFATSIQKVGTGSIGNCAGIPTPTPEPTATGTPAGTVTPGSTPTPESTATPTPTP